MTLLVPEDPFSLVGQVFDGNYDIIRVVGSGGLGVVYEARHKQLKQSRALKVLKVANLRDPKTAIERLWREARSCSALKDAGAVEVYEARVEEPGRRPYYVMDLLLGVSLHTQWMASPQRRMNPAEALNCLRQVARSMGAAHAAGIVHRDLKPENIFLCRDGAVKVLDFGSAHIAEEPRLTAPGALIGMPHYMPPEQLDFMRSKPDPRMDIYALGVTLYHVLSGRHVYPQHHDPVVVAKDVYLNPPRDLGDVAPDLPGDLHALVRRAIARNPEDRFATMQALEGEISRVLRSGAVPLRIGPSAATLSKTQGGTKKTLLQRLLPRRESPASESPTPAPDANAATLVLVSQPTPAALPLAAQERPGAVTPVETSKPDVAWRAAWRRTSRRRSAWAWIFVSTGVAGAGALSLHLWRRAPAPTGSPVATSSVAAPPEPPQPAALLDAMPADIGEHATEAMIVRPDASTSRARPPQPVTTRHKKNHVPPSGQKVEEAPQTATPQLDEHLNGLANPYAQ